ncbi:hypothetical protein [Chelativorans alearense]|uniref:hypothetical protein n=1 Tax=Chelativorans alearense TaxID=2681495 RepID=UPI0013D6C85A|nr:hypothetical protein [Chelativorans alearense]
MDARVIAIMVVAGLGAVAFFTTGQEPAETAAPIVDDCDRIRAFVASQTFVKREMKVPATAEFPYISSEGVSVTELGDCRFTVKAYVDAENSFGAKLRTPYSMDIRFNRADEIWSASNITH